MSLKLYVWCDELNHVEPIYEKVFKTEIMEPDAQVRVAARRALSAWDSNSQPLTSGEYQLDVIAVDPETSEPGTTWTVTIALKRTVELDVVEGPERKDS
jgi:hypothetical protein